MRWNGPLSTPPTPLSYPLATPPSPHLRPQSPSRFAAGPHPHRLPSRVAAGPHPAPPPVPIPRHRQTTKLAAAVAKTGEEQGSGTATTGEEKGSGAATSKLAAAAATRGQEVAAATRGQERGAARRTSRAQGIKMGKSIDKRKRMIRGAAIFVVCAAIVVAVRALKRKRRPRISYGPMHERDRMRIEYLNSKIWHSDVTCSNMLRFDRAPFFRLCEILRECKLLENSVHLCVEQQVAMFLHTVGHNVRNRVVATNFGKSYATISIYFRQVLHAIGELRNEYIRPASSETPEKIAGNHRFDSYFKDCIGAIDGTHVRASVTKDVEASFRGRKPFATQNVMAAVDFDLRFTYVLAGWEGTTHDANVLADALGRERGLQVPQGKYYLVDAGYGAKPGFIPPFRNVRYHLNEWGSNPVQNAEELFNLRHSSLRIGVERAFGSLKRRFKILDDAQPFFPFPVQVDIVVACCVLHNYALSRGIDGFIIPDVTWTTQPIRSQRQQARDHRDTVDRRQQIANQMWADRQIMYGH